MRGIDIPGISVESLRPGHSRILPHLRREDINEMRAFSDLDPAVGLAFSIANSRPGYAVLIDGEPAALFGAAPKAGGIGVPWLVGTDEIKKRPVVFYRVSKSVVEEMRQTYSFLENWVDERNLLSVRWLKWAGFTVEEPVNMGYGRFRRFWMGQATYIKYKERSLWTI
jgi:hypothetical protein